MRLLAACLIALLFCAVAEARPGQLDRSFGDDGVAVLPAPSGVARIAGILPAGRIVYIVNRDLVGALDRRGRPDTGFREAHAFAATVSAGGVLTLERAGRDASVARLHADGSPDPAFGDEGRMIVPARDASWLPLELLADPLGRVIVGADLDDPGSPEPAHELTRLTRAGGIDRSFGSGGRVNLPTDAMLDAAAVRADGALAVATYAPYRVEMGVISLTPTGGFDPGRMPIVLYGDKWLAPSALAFDERGRLLVAVSGAAGARILRLKRDGSRDARFRSPVRRGEIEALAIDRRGRVIAAANLGLRHAVVRRYGRRGRADRGFGHRGRTLIRDTQLSGLVLDRRGRIVIAGGSAAGHALIARLQG